MRRLKKLQFADLKSEVKTIAIDDLRKDADNYFEAVILKEETANLTGRLEKFLGLPAWPSKTSLSSEVENTIQQLGGIRPGQVLYFSRLETDTVFAMLWPWSDGKHTTLKIFKQEAV